MIIKYLFDDLKQLGRKKYYFRNGEEEIIFSRKNLEVEIVNINNHISLIINCNGIRTNYIDAKSLDDVYKKEIKLILDSYVSVEVKCKLISKVILDCFKK